MKIKTSELTGAPLDWAVEYVIQNTKYAASSDRVKAARLHPDNFGSDRHHYSSNWAQGGPIIEREEIELTKSYGMWCAMTKHAEPFETDGDTPLIAAMRCYVASQLGDEVDVPDELTGEQA